MLDDRSWAILNVLLKRKSLTMTDLLASLDLSQRQINYSLEKINDWFVGNGLLPLILSKNSMYALSIEMELFVLNAMSSQKVINESYVLNSQERRRLIFLKVFVKQDYLSLNHFIVELAVSRGTVLADLKRLRADLLKARIYIKYNRQSGYFFSGDEGAIRYQMMALIMVTVTEENGYQLLNHGIVLNQLLTVDMANKWLEERPKFFGIQMIEKKQNELVYMFIYLLPRLTVTNGDICEKKQVLFLKETKEYQFSTELLNHFSIEQAADANYLASWLLGISVGNMSEQTDDRHFIVTLVEKMVTRFEALTGTRFTNRKRIVAQIYQHLRPAYYRLYFNLPIINPLTTKIRQEYHEFYQIMTNVLKPFGLLFEEGLPDDEIAFLTIHFASFFFTEEDQLAKKKKAIVICPNGIGSSVILTKELQTLLPALEFIDTYHFQKVKEIPAEADIIFSTVTSLELLTTNCPSIVVSPIMSSREKYQVIQDVYAKLGEDTLIQPNLAQIMTIIKKYVPENFLLEIEEELYETLKQPKIEYQRGDGPLLSEIINEQLIQLNIKAINWEDAIRKAANPLLVQEMVTQQYIEGMIETTKEVGPYIVITKHVALPHARPELGAKEIAISIATLAEPIRFGSQDNDPVKYIFCLSAKDSSAHLTAMAELVELLERSEFYKVLDEAKASKEVFDYILNYERER